MKVPGRFVALAAAGAALATGVIAAPATADAPRGVSVETISVHTRGDGTKPPAELGNPKEWGVVKLTLDESSAGSVSPKTIVEVGGGKWSFGWYHDAGNGKYCYSNYYHGKERHASSVKIAKRKVHSGWVPAGDTSNANATAGLAYTCYAYYNKA